MIEHKRKINLSDEQNKYLIECFKFHSTKPDTIVNNFFSKYPGIKVSYSTLKNRYNELQAQMEKSKKNNTQLKLSAISDLLLILNLFFPELMQREKKSSQKEFNNSIEEIVISDSDEEVNFQSVLILSSAKNVNTQPGNFLNIILKKRYLNLMYLRHYL